MKNTTGHIAAEGFAPYTPSGNPRRFVKVYTTDGRLVDVITFDYGNVGNILRDVGVPMVSETGTATASEYRDLEGWRARISSGDPEWRPTAIRRIAESPNTGMRSYRVRFPNGRKADPRVSPHEVRSGAGERFEPLAHQ